IIGSTAMEKAFLITSWMIVMITELLNSAIETVVDRIGTEHHELSGRAKDIGSAAIFISLCLAACIWGFIIMGKIV
ncbi:MAG: diacylglycerol kinase, partial [Thermodesulfobacteriota bacterium]|nr:diacylglycerol kinase [Thermodesulfobacteriota bacterium]